MEHSCYFEINVTGLFTSRKDENATRPSILTQPRSQAVFLLVQGRRVGENPENKVDSHLPQLKCISNICWVTGRWTWAGVFYKQSYSAHSLPRWPVVKAKKEDNSLEKYIHRNLSMKGFDHRLCQGGLLLLNAKFQPHNAGLCSVCQCGRPAESGRNVVINTKMTTLFLYYL